jgi:AcrR family transcriptional regulator
MDIDTPMGTAPAPTGTAPAPTGNRRGQRSRQEILDAAARVMAARGYAGTSMSVLAKETGLPKSAFYHHFGSKAGLLSEVMARGARDFFAAMRAAHRDPPDDGTPRERLAWHLQRTGEVFTSREDFLRLLLVLVMSSEAAEAPEAMRTVVDVRDEGRDYMRHMICTSFLPAGKEAAAAVAGDLAHFGMAVFDGAFVSVQSGDRKPIAEFMTQLTDAIVAIGDARIAAMRAAGDGGG